MVHPIAMSAALTLAMFVGSTAQAQSQTLSPQCREARHNAIISGSAAGVSAGVCFATKSPAACATAGIAAVKFATDTQKMLKVCQPPPANRPAPPGRGR